MGQNLLLEIQKSRKEKAINLLKQFQVDGWLVIGSKNDPNLEYLLGIAPYSTTVAILTQDGLKVLASSLEESMVRLDHVDEVVTYYGVKDLLSKLITILADYKNKLFLINNASPILSPHASKIYSGHEKIVTKLGEILNIKFEPAHNYVLELRGKKTDSELKALDEAAKKSDEIIMEIIDEKIKIGVTEKDVAAEIYREFYKIGLPAFEIIVAFGENTANPHHATSLKKLRYGEIGYIDAGLKYLTLCGDITRTFFTSGYEKKAKEVYEVVKEAQDKAINAVHVGEEANKPDAIARETISSKGLDPKAFSHGLGHPLGVEVHDVGPALSYLTPAGVKLFEKMALTVEPALYFKGRWGIRLEDDVILLKNKTIRITESPQDPPII